MDREDAQIYLSKALKKLNYHDKEKEQVLNTFKQVMNEEWIAYSGVQLKKPYRVEGFEVLEDEQKRVFEKFLRKFYSSWEKPEVNIPMEVSYKNNQLKVMFIRRNQEEEYLVTEIDGSIIWA